jgi:hypothetical protein
LHQTETFNPDAVRGATAECPLDEHLRARNGNGRLIQEPTAAIDFIDGVCLFSIMRHSVLVIILRMSIILKALEPKWHKQPTKPPEGNGRWMAHEKMDGGTAQIKRERKGL